MDCLFLNLPASRPLARRWVASYYLPNFFMPPDELLSAAAAVRERNGFSVRCLDAVAEGLDDEACRRRLDARPPDVVVTLLGFEVFAEDLDRLGRIVPGGTKVVTLGYLAGLFPAETMARGPVDAVVEGEAELALPALLRAWAEGGAGVGLPGVHVMGPDGPRLGPPPRVVEPLDHLPLPAWDLVDRDRYHEPFLPGPFATITAARGCPHDCRFCVRSHGRKRRPRSLASLKDELDALRTRWGYGALRFMDDCLPQDKEAFLALCELLGGYAPLFSWTCLSRPDCLDAQRVRAMAAAGCRRVYLGVETASPRLLAWLKKGYGPEDCLRAARLCHEAGLEVSGYFIVGIPGERESDLEATASLARDMDCDFAIVTRLQWWPGTELGDELGAGSRAPFRFDFPRDPEGPDPFEAERRLYRAIYLRPGRIASTLRRLAAHPLTTLRSAWGLLRWLASSREGDFI